MGNFFSDNDDLQYYFERGIDWDALVETTEYGYRTKDGFKNVEEAKAFYREVADMVGTLVADEIAPRAAAIDREGAHLENGVAHLPKAMDEVFKQIKGLDLHKLCLPRELGGLNAPMMLYFLNAEMMARADVSTMTHHSFHAGIALALLIFSIQEGSTTFDVEGAAIASTRFAKEIEEIARGDAWGCMDITEPDAGSDMAALRAFAEQDEAGNWHLSGQKIFITSGHGKYHLVIARTETAKASADPMAGLKGLSMFLVKMYEDQPDGTRKNFITIDRLEEKLGHHGSVTAALSFDRAPAQLIGKRGEGFRYMLTLMNNARLGVGFESLGLCETALRAAKDYAAGRRSMGKTIDRHEMIADYIDEMESDCQAIRALAVHGAYHEELAQKIAILQQLAPGGDVETVALEKRARRHRRHARKVTPLLKYLAAEKAVEMSRRALQIHGGSGYTKDYAPERLLRDALVMPIYEGTSQIQALMAMKDALGAIIKKPQKFITKLAQARWRSLSAKDELERRVSKIQFLCLSAQQHLATRTAAQKIRALGDKPVTAWKDELTKNWDPKRDFALAMLHAERLIKLLTDEAVCEIMLAQAKKHPERRAVLARYLERAELRARALHEEITTSGARLLATLHGGEADPETAAG
jgi:alkylation response protein AidB-like acyl-CoA dehydrogenase